MNEITLQQILDAREARMTEQNRLLRLYSRPLVSFSMNIAGPIKRTALIERTFSYGLRQLEEALRRSGASVLYQAEMRADTGCEAFYAVDLDARTLKEICVSVEEASPVGRLFDLDVLDRDGQKLQRSTERRCLVCGAAGRGCASRRIHSVAELQEATKKRMVSHFSALDAEAVSKYATDALIEEVYTTPKPGLVDRNNCGSHRDMTVETFLASAEALRGYWADCFRIGQQTCAEDPEETFRRLREAGKAAEAAMYEATGGVNTHKGAVYALGIVCGAAGRLWKPESPFADPEEILRVCSELTKESAAEDFRKAASKAESERTAGERLYLQYGFTGIRGEAAAGFPSVRNTALPVFQKMIREGHGRNEAGSVALLALIALGIDTNMVKRGGIEAAEKASGQAGTLLENKEVPSEEEILELDRMFISQNLSPGGCADLLAVTYFLNALMRQ